MKIYDWPTGPYPARVRIALAEKNLQSRVQFVTVNLWKRAQETRLPRQELLRHAAVTRTRRRNLHCRVHGHYRIP
jgi:glutathione S-transferase